MALINLRKSIISSPVAFICNLILVYIMYAICRVAYLMENWTALSEGFDSLSWTEVVKGCLLFDTSAILYTNAVYAIMMLIPLHYKETDVWQNIAKWLYIIINSVCIIMNLADAVYFQYTGRRTTSSVSYWVSCSLLDFSSFMSSLKVNCNFGIKKITCLTMPFIFYALVSTFQ